MLSCIYEGTIGHRREKPSAHAFSYRAATFLTRLDEIDQVCSLSPFLSRERWNLLSFRRQDYLPSTRSLKEEVVTRIREHRDADFEGEVFMLANWRQWGYLINPLTMFYCFEGSRLRWVVAEVHNTPWGERHVYVLDPTEDGFPLHDKEFHVSPFMPMATAYRWRISEPEDSLNLGIEVLEGGERMFSAGFRYRRTVMSRGAVHGYLIRFPFMTLKTLLGIYFEALRLWWKKVPFHRHPGIGPRQEISPPMRAAGE